MALTQYDWHLCKKGKFGHRHVREESIVGRLEACCQKQGTGRSQERGLFQAFPRGIKPSFCSLFLLYYISLALKKIGHRKDSDTLN